MYFIPLFSGTNPRLRFFNVQRVRRFAMTANTIKRRAIGTDRLIASNACYLFNGVFVKRSAMFAFIAWHHRSTLPLPTILPP